MHLPRWHFHPSYTLSLWLVLAGITSSNSSSPVRASPPPIILAHILGPTGDAGVGKSSLLVRLTDQRFLANPDPTVRILFPLHPVFVPTRVLVSTPTQRIKSLASNLAQN
jgi:hypothetical protein